MPENSDLITIVISAYNIQNYISRCIESVLNQDYRNIEAIVVNDGSTDSTLDALSGITDTRLRILSKKNGGLSSARNFGIDNANGKYIVFIDGDDYIAPDMIGKLYRSLKKNKVMMSICDYQAVDENENQLVTNTHSFNEKISVDEYWEILYKNSDYTWGVVAWNKLYDISIFKNIRYPLNKLHEDDFILTDILDVLDNVSVVNEKLYFYRKRGSSITKSAYTIRRMDGIEAKLKRNDYFIQTNNTKLIKYSINQIVWSYCEAYKSGIKSDDFKKRFNSLQKAFKLQLKKLSFKEYNLFLIYWKLTAYFPQIVNIFLNLRGRLGMVNKNLSVNIKR